MSLHHHRLLPLLFSLALGPSPSVPSCLLCMMLLPRPKATMAVAETPVEARRGDKNVQGE